MSVGRKDGRPAVPEASASVASPAPARSSAGEIDTFLGKAAATDPQRPRGRLVFALDATMSRQPTWDHACEIQAEMFAEAGRIGGLDVQLVYFRGFGECKASRFVADAGALAGLMTRIDCRGGHTQIGRVLSHALATSRERKVDALVFVGDAMEERLDDLADGAGQLGLLGTRTFLFQEGRDPTASRAFAEIARLTGGAHLVFDRTAIGQLAGLLRAVAAYAAGGLTALEDLGRREREAARLLSQMT